MGLIKDIVLGIFALLAILLMVGAAYEIGYVQGMMHGPVIATATPTATPEPSFTPSVSALPSIEPSILPTVTPEPNATVTVTPIPANNWTLLDCGLDKTAYKPGETAVVFALIQNAAGQPITAVDVKAVIYRKQFGMNIPVLTKTTTIQTDIVPGTAQRVEYAIQVPASVDGFPTNGNYDITATISSAGYELGERTMPVTIG